MDYNDIKGLSTESREKLKKVNDETFEHSYLWPQILDIL
ncbi:MAG: hypothetical protein ACFFD6_05675 [Candidatus Thorarchaeota archaeon]